MFYIVTWFKILFCSNAFANQIKKIAYFQPLTILEIEAVHKNKGTLEHFKEIKINSPFRPYIQIFIKYYRDVLSEILHSIHEEEKTKHFFLF
jgi:DNA repair protein RecO (recombination protein O)